MKSSNLLDKFLIYVGVVLTATLVGAMFIGSCAANEEIPKEIEPVIIDGRDYSEDDARMFVVNTHDVRIAELEDSHIVAWEVPENIWELDVQIAVDFAAAVLMQRGYELASFKGYGLWRENEQTTISVFYRTVDLEQ